MTDRAKNNFITYTSFGLLAMAGVLLSISKIYDDDLFWHLATGRWIWEHTSIPSVDVFGYVTQGTTWIPFEWGWDIMCYILYSLTGNYILLQLVPTLVLLMIGSLLVLTMKQLNISRNIILVTLLLTLFVLLDRLTVRPHLISLLGISLVLYFLFKSRNLPLIKLRQLYILPLIFLVWVNMHMGVLVGITIFFIFLISEIIRYFVTPVVSLNNTTESRSPDDKSGSDQTRLFTLGIIFIFCVSVLPLNPHGIETFLYVSSQMNMKFLMSIKEWLPPLTYPSSSIVLLLYKVMLLVAGVCMIYSFKNRDYFPLFVYVLFAFLSIKAIRFTSDFVLATSIGTALGIHHLLQRTHIRTHAMREGNIVTSTISAILCGVVLLIPGDFLYANLHYERHFGFGVDAEYFSVPLMNFLKDQQIRGTPFNQFELGGQLIWERPTEKNFIDSRNLSDEIAAEYFSIAIPDPGFEKKLDNYGIDYLVLHAGDLRRSTSVLENTLIPYCTRHPNEWKLVYWDDQSFLYLKNISKFKQVIKNYEYKILQPYLFTYVRYEFDSLCLSMPQVFEHELKRKLAEEPNGIVVNSISRQIQTPVAGN